MSRRGAPHLRLPPPPPPPQLFNEREQRDGEQAHYVQIHTEDKWAWDLVTAEPIVEVTTRNSQTTTPASPHCIESTTRGKGPDETE